MMRPNASRLRLLGAAACALLFAPPGVATAADVLVKNATIWTQSDRGKLNGADLLVRDGKVARVGTGLQALRSGTGQSVAKQLSRPEQVEQVAVLDCAVALGHRG